MPSHSILPESRRAAIEASFDEALAEVRAAGDVALLQECRAIFRKRVPFNLRAYVAAALALKTAGGARPSDRRGRISDAGRSDRSRRDAKENGDFRNGAQRDGGKPQKGSARAAPSGAQQPPLPKKTEKQRREQEPRENREPAEIREPRENRYRGEGVTLFVSAGRRQRFYARVAIRLLLDIPGVVDESVGDIRTMDNYSFIVVDPTVEEAVIAALSGYDFKGRILAINRARKRGEPAPLREEGAGIAGSEDDHDESGLAPFGAAPSDEDTPADDFAADTGSYAKDDDVGDGAGDALQTTPESEDQ